MFSKNTNVCKVHATTFLGFLWPNISTPLATVFLMSRCVVWHYAVVLTFHKSNVRCGWFSNETPFSQKDWRSISVSFELGRYIHPMRIIMHACASIIFMMFMILRTTVQHFFFSHWRKVINLKWLCFLKTSDTFWYFFTEYYLISYCFMGLFWRMDFDLASGAALAITDKRNNSFPRTLP